MHGEAVAIGMAMAAGLSERIVSFKQTSRLLSLLEKYELPTSADYSKKKIFEILISDKKRDGNSINFILLEQIGKAVIRKIPFDQLYKLL
jgi:3-dehydroquinate synthase